MCAEDEFMQRGALVQNGDNCSRTISLPYPEVVNYLLKTFATDKDVAEYDAAIRRYMQLFNTTLQQYADKLDAEFCKVAVVYNKSTLKDAFIDNIDLQIRHSFRICWKKSPSRHERHFIGGKPAPFYSKQYWICLNYKRRKWRRRAAF